MKKSSRTIQCKNLTNLFSILHLGCLFGPLLYFVPYAFATGTTGNKIGLSLFLIVSVCLSLVSLFGEAKTRGGLNKTIMWVLIMGVLMCLAEAKTFIYIMAIVSILDELVIVKLKDKYKDAYAANREIDRRE